MREAVVFETSRDGYGIEQMASRAVTVGELREMLEEYDDDVLFVLSHDGGYTYGTISGEEMFDGYETTDEDGDREWKLEENWDHGRYASSDRQYW